MSTQIKNPTTTHDETSKNTLPTAAESNSANTCDKCKVIAIELTKDANNIVTERQLSLDNIPPLPAQVITINVAQDSLNKPITLENGAVIQVNEDGSVIFHDKGAYDSLQVGESTIAQFQINVIDFNENLIAINLELEQMPPAVEMIQDEGSITVVEVQYPGLEGNVESLPRDLGINYSFEPFTSYTPTLVQPVKLDSQPIAPLIILDPVFESNLGNSSSSSEQFTSFILVDSDNCQSCIANSPNTITTNIFAEGASFGLDGAGSFGLLPFIRQGVTIDDITANQAAIGFTDPGGISHFYPAPFQQQSTFFQDPNGAFQTITTPEGNTLTLYLTNYMGHSMGDLVYEFSHNVPHIPNLPGLNVIDTVIELQNCGCYSANCTLDAQVFFDPFMYYIQDADGDLATNFILARIVDDVPMAAQQFANISEADIMDIGSNDQNVPATITGFLIDNFTTRFGADGGIVSNVTIENGTTVISPENNLITVTTQEGNVLEVVQTTGQYTYYLNHPIDNDSSDNASDFFGYDNFHFELTDFDFDQASNVLTINIADDTPVVIAGDIVDITLSVDESNFAVNDSANFSGAFDIIPGADQAASIVYSLELPGSDTDSGLVDSITNEAVIMNVVNGIIIGSSATGGEVFRVSVNDASGLVTLDQSRAVMHGNPNDPNDVVSIQNDLISLRVTVTDNDQDAASASILLGGVIQFRDDAPTAVADAQLIVKDPLPEYNLTFVIDNSNSMSVDLGQGLTRLQVLQQTLAGAGGILDAYAGASSKLTISIVNFSDTAGISNEFNNIQDAKDYINNLAIPGNGHVGTVLGSGVEVALADIIADGNNAALANAHDVLYLLTDGAPAPAEWEQGTTQGEDHALVDADELADWQAALLAQNVDAIMVNIGGTNQAITNNIAPLANPTDNPAVLEADASLSNLQALLQDQLTLSVTGNLLTNDSLSADAPTVVTHVSFSLNSEAEAQDYLNNHPELIGASVSGSVVTIPISDGAFTTSLGNTLLVEANGNYTYSYINNAYPESEDFTYTIKDQDLDPSSATFSVSLISEGPTAVADVRNIEKSGLPAYNLTFIIDVSGSMGTPIGNLTRLDLVIAALAGDGALLDSYATHSSSLSITIIPFETQVLPSMDFNNVADAKTYLEGLTAGGGTNLSGAISAGLADINNDSLLNSAILDRVYLLSDGAPSPGDEVTVGQQTDWQSALLSQNVDAIMLNIGGLDQDVTNNLAPLANPSDSPAVIEVAADLSNLQVLLQETVSDPVSVTGNILVNDIVSADPPNVVTQISFDLASALDAQNYIAAHPELAGASASGSTIHIPIPNGEFITPLGNTLQIESDGDYTYSYINNVNTESEVFTYTIQDSDFDMSSTNFTINLIPPDSFAAPIVLDLNNDGQIELVSAAQSQIEWNISSENGTQTIKTGWVGPNDGILVYDQNTNGKVDGLNEIELSKYHADAVTDIEGLKLAFDSNHDDKFNKQDDKFNDFLVWNDINQDGSSQGNELKSLNDYGIISIDLTQLGHSEMVNGNIVFSTLSYENASGSVSLAGDVGLQIASVSSVISSDEVVEPPNQLENVLSNSLTQASSNSANPTLDYNSSFNASEHQETLQMQQVQQQQHEAAGI
ncbi:DUF5801 repeats-in-toxin domain-containing protein [Candidatus Berkiella aquae]|uniref:VWA domain-containing protein n=1 Tax=Candidatus Berkiella aquae TaxID=295108 RepID=A0AAE3HW07_9GAMM|nr:DUF5801 repeats-in-toxin domain-containing protein [Candidatus Berkiella aquae]MCS5710514.1 VWA domain-containing protein [Candidatus Berkiella aquae]